LGKDGDERESSNSRDPMTSQNPYEAPLTPTTPDTRGSSSGQFAPCPTCGQSRATRVGYTFWGGFIGPKLLTHVKCAQCGTTYNGKTGRSNATAITLYMVISIGIGLVLGVAFVLMKLNR
jgi:uncharacterized protein (DUF983 family)